MSNTRSFRTVATVFGLVSLTGVGALIHGATRHVYRVQYGEASTAFMRWCTAEPDVDPIAGDQYLAMFGDRYTWMDLGLGLATTGLAGLLLAAILYFSRHEAAWLRTPSKRWHFMLAGWGVIVWTCFSAVYSIIQDFERHQLPWCADSIIIGIFETVLGGIFLLAVCSVVGLLLILRFGALPVRLDRWDHTREGYSWIATIILGGLMVLVAASMILDSRRSMSIANPAGLIAIYLLASARAALLAPRRIDE